MFTKLLVPLDGTAEAAVALPPARGLAVATHASVVLLRTIPTGQDAFASQDADLAAEYLKGVQRELAGAGIPVTTSVRRGEPAEEIVGEAVAHNADLIVMATHGRSGVGRMVLGSVATAVLERSPIPLMLMRPGGRRTTEIKRLFVPVDGTPGGSLALGAAVGLARATGAKIFLLEVVVPVPAYAYEAMPGATLGGYVDTQWDLEAQDSARGYVDGLAARLRATGIDAEGHARVGAVAETLAAAAKEVDADVLVMSTHALTGPARALLGSVADEMVRRADRPVLVVRREAPSPHERETRRTTVTLAAVEAREPEPIPTGS